MNIKTVKNNKLNILDGDEKLKIDDKYFIKYAQTNNIPLQQVMQHKKEFNGTLSFNVFCLVEHLKEIFIYPFKKGKV